MNHQHVGSPMSSDVVPHRILLNNGKLTLNWIDKEATLDGTLLRAACRCAGCRMVRLKAGDSVDAQLPITTVTANVTVTSVASMGYGLQVHFSDGHNRGIFPWAYLRGLAQPL